MIKKGFYRFVPILYDDESWDILPMFWGLYPLLEFVLWFDMCILKVKTVKILTEDGDEIVGNL